MSASTMHITLAPEWRIVPEFRQFALFYRNPARLRWVHMYQAETMAEAGRAYIAYSEGESPEPSEVWP